MSQEAQKIAMTPQQGKPELIVIFESSAGVRAQSSPGMTAVASSSGNDVSGVQSILSKHNASLKLLFGPNEDRLRASLVAASSTAQKIGQTPPDLTPFYSVQAAEDKLDQLAKELRAERTVKAAYVKPGAAPAIFAQPDKVSTAAVASVTPNYQSRQSYLDPAPKGVDAAYANSIVGGSGERMKVCSVEFGWLFTHEDLMENQSGVIAGTAPVADNHGTATVGIVGADKNPYGVTGIVPRAISCASSVVDQTVAAAIKNAADKMSPGDIIFMSLHRPGPNTTGSGQFGFIALEWWPDDFAAIKYATSKGIIFVEAAGNGYQNLDDPIYETARAAYGFPSSYPNPFNTANPSSGAVIVGGGAPPEGTHGHSWWGPDRSRLAYSNYGSRVDCQGQGYDVTTTGYGDLQGGGRPELYYTDTFSGTSSATPIVASALCAAQGILKDFGRRPITGEECRQLVRSTGSPQQDGLQGPKEGQRIGNRPDLRQLIPAALKLTEWRPNARL
ncbi:subtilisin-like protein [Lindgomyces ingoldianus]|uniref:Subtilisin-like protein n=1 Tax=Lindgomyces ingoldianus TaxID=673940 RepID=A0ACB6QK88_9PLEO|nr:subtilisin-like protein [Lindgomyces ingoldianus]KAF2467341.1 subtilisin-like protein [Lindgomyces ingoldianus]